MVRLLLFKYISTSSTSLSFACQWKTLFIVEIFCWFSFLLFSRHFCHVSFDLSSFVVFLTIQQNLKPFPYTPLSLSVASCGQLSLSPSDSMLSSYGWLFVWMSLSTCLFPVIVCAQVCGKVGVLHWKIMFLISIFVFFYIWEAKLNKIHYRSKVCGQ